MTTFEIREVKGNKPGTLPPHFDIYAPGSAESIITVWDSREMANECVKFLETYPARRDKEDE